MAGGFDVTQFGFLVRAFTVLFALGISYISFEGWRRRKRPLLLLVSIAFLAYLLRDLVRFSEIVMPGSTSPIFVSLADILDLVTLLLIFFAVARK